MMEKMYEPTQQSQIITQPGDETRINEYAQAKSR